MKHPVCILSLLFILLTLSACESDLKKEIEELEAAQAALLNPDPDSPPVSPAASAGETAEQTATATPAEPAAPIENKPAEATAASAKTDTLTKLPMLNVPTFNYFDLPENSQPLFSKSCLMEKDPGKCSGLALQKYLAGNIEYREVKTSGTAICIEYISFTINEFGKVTNIQHVGTKGSYNEERAHAAIEAIRNMPEWMPGIRNGKPVSISVVLPVRFDVV